MTEEDDQEEVYAEHGILEDDITVPAYIRSETFCIQTFKICLMANSVYDFIFLILQNHFFCKSMIYANIPVMHISHDIYIKKLITRLKLKFSKFLPNNFATIDCLVVGYFEL